MGLALSAATSAPAPGGVASVLDAVIRSRAVVLDEMAERHRAAAVVADPELARRTVFAASLAMVCYGFGFGAAQTFVPVMIERFQIGRVGAFSPRGASPQSPLASCSGAPRTVSAAAR